MRRPHRWWPRSLRLAAAVLSGSAIVLPVPARAQSGARGSLFIVGGGPQPPELAARFVALAARSGMARIAVIPIASENAETDGQKKAAELRPLGVDVVVLNFDRAAASKPAIAERIAGMTGIWFSGGDQSRLANVLRGTAALEAIRARYHAGAVIGGASAGASVMSDSMLTGNQREADTATAPRHEFRSIARGNVEIVPGLGLLSGVIIDQHFFYRERFNRLFSAVLERPTLQGVGLDEGAALEIGPEGPWQVLGRSAVMIIDARRARVTGPGTPVLGGTGVIVLTLPPGSRYWPKSGRAVFAQ